MGLRPSLSQGWNAQAFRSPAPQPADLRPLDHGGAHRRTVLTDSAADGQGQL